MAIALIVAIGLLAVWAIRKFSQVRGSQKKSATVEYPVAFVDSTDKRITFGEYTIDEPKHDGDAWEGSFWEASHPKTIQIEIILDYIDGRGNRTNREVLVRQFDDEADLFIGHCYLRDATRTFRFSRVVSCADAKTGEVIPDFKSYCRSEYENTTDHSLDMLVEANRDALSIAFYVGKADGRLTKKENAEIARFAAGLVEDPRLDAEMIRKMFSDWGLPSLQSYRLAVGRLRTKPPEYKIALISTCDAMLATESTRSQAEAEAVDYLKKKLLENV